MVLDSGKVGRDIGPTGAPQKGRSYHHRFGSSQRQTTWRKGKEEEEERKAFTGQTGPLTGQMGPFTG